MSADESLALAEREVEVSGEGETTIAETSPGDVIRIGGGFAENFQQYMAERQRRAQTSPSVRPRNWQVSFGPVAGEADTKLRLVTEVRALFRGERIRATDTASPAGCGTRIEQLLVNGKPQDKIILIGDEGPTPLTANLLTVFANREVAMDAGITIELTISFIVSCTFEMSIFGKAIV